MDPANQKALEKMHTQIGVLVPKWNRYSLLEEAGCRLTKRQIKEWDHIGDQITTMYDTLIKAGFYDKEGNKA